MNLTRISCISPISPLLTTPDSRRYGDGMIPHISIDSGALTLRVAHGYYYLRVDDAADEIFWAGDSGIDDVTIPETSPWSPDYEPD